MDEKILSKTESVCPVCLKKLDAERVAIKEDIYLRKKCPEHGTFQTIIWRGKPSYRNWEKETENVSPKNSFTNRDKGCPYDCGICNEHKQQACCVLIEVTQRCNQNCNVCFADTKGSYSDPTIEEIKDYYKTLLDAGEERPFNIQLSGGEPTIRDDLPEIIKIGKSMGFPYIQLNTNGKRLAEDLSYVKKLKEAGLSAVFLQFDGTKGLIYEKLRGKNLLEEKKKAIENCAKNHLGVVLVPTLVPGVNTENIGEIIFFAIKNLPYVRGVHFQPISYFGRYPKDPKDLDRITIPEILENIEKQTNNLLKVGDFTPLQSGNCYCSFHSSFIYMEDKSIQAISSHESSSSCCSCKCSNDSNDSIIKARDFIAKKWTLKEEKESCCNSTDYNVFDWDKILYRINNYGFSITAMAFQDAWNLDLDRLQKCRVHVMSPNKKLIPFCAYNLTDQCGNPLYRGVNQK